MRRTLFSLFGVALVVIPTLLFVGCTEAGSEIESTESTEQTLPVDTSGEFDANTYFFQLKYEDAWGVMTLTVNGFPVNESGGGHITNNPVLSIDLTTALIGPGNEVEIRAEPMIRPSGGGLRIGAVDVYGQVTRDYDGNVPVKGVEITPSEVDSAYGAWTERARAQWAEYWSRVERGALDSIRAWAERHPMTVSTTFDNEAGPDFSEIFEEAPVIGGTPQDTSRLKDYAMRLRELMARKDTAKLMEAFLPSLWRGRDSLDVSTLRASVPEARFKEVRQQVVMDRLYLAIERSEVGLRRWVDGRVWEIYYKPDGGAFFAVKTRREGTPQYTGSGLERTIYVAEIGGKLHVVR